MIRLCAFLGNYGNEYHNHRHNVAWLFLESMRIGASLQWSSKFKGHIAQAEIGSEKVYFLKPYTFMNLSGASVVEAAHFFRCRPEEILVVHDELEMPFGTFGYKFSGGLGGHNGLRSLEQHLGTRDFWRLRFGIGRPDHNDIAGYVLSSFTEAQFEILKTAVFPAAEESFYALFSEGIDGFELRYKKVVPTPPAPRT
jgi:PTH1 family peptidyl-tRNA hydrolase